MIFPLVPSQHLRECGVGQGFEVDAKAGVVIDAPFGVDVVVLNDDVDRCGAVNGPGWG